MASSQGKCHGSFGKQEYPFEGAICYSEGIEGWWRTDCEHIPSSVKRCCGFEVAPYPSRASTRTQRGMADVNSLLQGKLINQGWSGPDCTCKADYDRRKMAGKTSLFGF